jgi:hypothetical protein
MKKWLAVFLILSLGVTALSGCGKDAEYAWVLVETQTNEEEWRAHLAELNASSSITGRPPDRHAEVEVSEGSVFFVITYTESIGEDVEINSEYFSGNSIQGKIAWSVPPHTVPATKDGFTLKLLAETLDRHPIYPMNHTFGVVVWTLLSEQGEDHYHVFEDSSGNSSFGSNEDNDFAPIDTTVYGTLGKGQEEGARKVVTVDVGFVRTSYIYEWQEQ